MLAVIKPPIINANSGINNVLVAFLKVLFLSHASTVPMASSLFMIASVISYKSLPQL